MKSAIHVCSDWESTHERPVYTLGDTCPSCGADAVNTAPAPFGPEDPYGAYRRSLKRSNRE
jgi:H/ACA ribonucleoprotein complex subunit 3